MEHAKHLFIVPGAKPRQNWLEAFPDAQLYDRLPPVPEADVVWVLLPEEGDIVKLLSECRAAAGELPIVAMSDVPSDGQGLRALGAGVVGYCNGQAAPEVLRQVAEAVLDGGLWVGQWLMQRVLKGIAQVAARDYTPPEQSAWASHLTEREVEIARTVATGASNKEIAARFDITERTVKAHLGSIFEKLKVRDRLQLTLRINGILKG